MRIDDWLTIELNKLEFKKTNVVNELPQWVKEMDIMIYSQKYNPDLTEQTRNSVRVIANSLRRITKCNDTDFEIMIKILRKIGVMGRSGRDAVRSWTCYVPIDNAMDLPLEQRKILKNLHDWLK